MDYRKIFMDDPWLIEREFNSPLNLGDKFGECTNLT